MRNKVKIYCFSSLILALILTLLRCVSLTAFYDAQIGYFNSAFIVTLMNALYVIGSLWCISALIFIPKASIETKFTPSSVWEKSASMFATVLFLFSAVSIFTASNSSRFGLAIALSVLISASFFILTVPKSKTAENIRAFASIAIVATLTIILASLYFDMTIAMNSPNKIHGSFVLMSAMIFALCETRTYLGKPLARIHLASALLTFTLGISFSVSAVAYIFTSHPSAFASNPVILGNIGYVGIIIGISVYALSRSFTFTDAQPNQAAETDNP